MGSHGKPLVKSKYRTEVRRDHPLAMADGRVRVHRAVLYDKIGAGAHLCHWGCGQEVHWHARGKMELVADHVDEDTWNNDPENLVPSCRTCNLHRRQRALNRCNKGHEFTEENTYIRPDGKGRQCRICNQEREAKRVRAR